jgi:peptide/nickel transport system substrate-binding protein
VQTWQPTKQIVFTRNPAWKSATDPVRHAYVDKVVVNETVSQDSAQQQLQTGTPAADMEFDDFTPPSKVPSLVASKDPNFNLGPTDSSNPYVVFNLKSPTASGALQNLQVREALEYAINRQDILQVLGGAKQNPPLTHVLPSGVVGSMNFDLYPYDPGKAKQLLAAAGHASGLTLKLLYRNQSEGSSKAFQVIQQDLGKVGIKVEGVASPTSDFYTKYLEKPSAATSGAWDLALAGWGPDWYGNSALSFFAPLFNGTAAFPPAGSNFGFYNDPKATTLIQQASSSTDQDQAATLWAQADRQVMEDAPFFPITEPLQPNYHAAQVHNAVYIPYLQNFDPANVWLEPGKNGD